LVDRWLPLQVDRPYGHERGAEAFFESFQQSFTREEWALIRNGVGDKDRGEGSLGSEGSDGEGSDGGDSDGGCGGGGGGDDGKFRRFYRLWALKEAYIKVWG
jgi:hypothetical protein